MDGQKFDDGKVRWSLIPYRQLEDAAKVLTFGAKKYGYNNWRDVPNAEDRYFNAIMRHLVAWKEGELFDSETQLPHMAHVICNAFFLGWFDRKAAGEE